MGALSKMRTSAAWILRAVLLYFAVKFVRARRVWVQGLRHIESMDFPTATFKSFLSKTMLGNIPEQARNLNRVYDFRLDLFSEYGSSFFWVSPIWNPHPTLSTTDPAIVKHILKDNFENYLKSDMLVKRLGDLLGSGIFGINHGPHAADQGKQWYFQRKTASKVFTRNVFKTKVHDTFIQNTTRLCGILDKFCASGKTIDLQKMFFKFTLDTIGEIGFGVDLNTLSTDRVEFADAFDNFQRNIPNRLFRPRLGPLDPILFGSEREMRKSLRILNDFSYEIIRDRRQPADLSSHGDILSLFLQADPGLSDKFLRDIVMSFFIAGRDTTACTLSFTFMLLAEHKDIQKRLQEEVDQKLGSASSSATVSDLDKDKMPYLNGVIMEALRMFPPVPVDGKQAVEDDVLPGGQKIYAGTKVVYEVYCMGRNPAVYENPSEFRPERWLHRETPTEYEFPVFQAGPRFCLGRELALYEAKFLTAELMKRYSVEMDRKGPAPEVPYNVGITLTAKGGVPVKITKRYS